MAREADAECCGICLSDDGKSIRGEIDSCDHYFCFVCIMEWAKVESRCPMCKRRFTNIRRPPKHGVFSRHRLVNVPKRDQVYHLSGNASIGPFDPYCQVECSVCHSMADECFLLLCDLCDSAAHTYCVGLGFTVPDGDWFCNDCAVLRAVHNNTEIDVDGENQHLAGDSDVLASSETDASIYNIVHESNNPVIERQLSFSVITGKGKYVADGVSLAGTRTHENIAGKANESGARTLHRCRNVHNRVQALRENWDALRNGALRFPSSSVESGESSGKCNSFKQQPDRSLGPSRSFPSINQQSIGQDGTLRTRGSCDIDKAWKMMDIAKSIENKYERDGSVCRASKYHSAKGNPSRQATNVSPASNVTKRQRSGIREVGSTGIEKQDKYGCLQRKIEKHKSPKLEKQNKEIPNNYSPVYFESSSSYGVQTYSDVCLVNGERLLPKHMYGDESNSASQHGGDSCLVNLAESMPGTSDSLNAKLEFLTSSSCKIDIIEEAKRLGKHKSGKGDDAKREIQSLVKLNLKHLSIDKQLGVDAFKEVARVSTHTILGACGLEPPKSGIRSFPNWVCNHPEQSDQFRKSTLMSNSCRECFNVFVKDVVRSIMFDKVGRDKL
ncbi:PHD domain-containing protein/zf-RING_2 domain-containing protein [Cephalotus follicularis]|uniref:PHD domain-containing protein/zf-RING_2 domain-containing protein n=1 Tax=Cephalotus follicularis TaxID=3775 RepID=A0A1Q3B903_CEPFO|nr:PHD domain-containing protein/zf-RING_2 domain-containing protein [Cephalotus follicularis]